MSDELKFTEEELEDMADKLLEDATTPDITAQAETEIPKAKKKPVKKKEPGVPEEPVKTAEERLNELLEKGKKPMPIKAGARAPRDIVIEAGETSFSPGPMVGKLQAAGIPAAIKGGKVVINQKVTLAKEGEVVPAKTADILKTMEIFPRNVGLELRAAYEGGLIFKVSDLTIDVEAQLSELSAASAKAFGLAVEIGYATPSTVGPMLARAQRRAHALVLETGMPVPGMMEMLLAKAAANARALAALASGEAAPAAPAAAAPEAEAAAPEEKEEKKDEEETAAGLGALFG